MRRRGEEDEHERETQPAYRDDVHRQSGFAEAESRGWEWLSADAFRSNTADDDDI